MPLKQVMPKRISLWAVIVAGGLALAAGASQPESRPPRYDALPMKVAQAMLWTADAGAADVVYDLGCGDGDIVTIAARRLGARAVCVGTDRRRIAGIEAAARQAGVADRIRFLDEDLRATAIGEATVVILRLPAPATLELRPKLLRELRPGTRIVSHEHGMGDWKPDLTAYLRSGGRERPVYRWTVPRR